MVYCLSAVATFEFDELLLTTGVFVFAEFEFEFDVAAELQPAARSAIKAKLKKYFFIVVDIIQYPAVRGIE